MSSLLEARGIHKRFGELMYPYCLAAGAALVALAGLIGIIEMVYRLSEPGASTVFTGAGLSFDARTASPWIAFAAVLAAGLFALHHATRFVGARWAVIQHDLLARPR